MSRTNLTDATTNFYGTYTIETQNVRISGPGDMDFYFIGPVGTVKSESVVRRVILNRTSSITTNFWSPTKRSGLLFPNDFYFTKEEKFPAIKQIISLPKYPQGFTGSVRKEYGASQYSTALSGLYPPPQSVIDAAHRDLKNKLLLKIKDQKVNLAQAMAERKQTADLVMSSLQTLAKAYGRARRGDIVGAAKAMGVPPPRGIGLAEGIAANPRRSAKNNTSRRWLELQYGWKPLLNDIYGAVDAYHKSRMNHPVYQRVAVQKDLTNDYREKSIYGNVYDDTSWVMTSYCKMKIKYVCWFTADNTVLKTLSELGITNPLLIAWELTPWSFVVDWFIPIGNFISTLDATLGLKFVMGTVTESEDHYQTKEWIYLKPPTWAIRSGVEYQSRKYFKVRRSRLSGFPSSQLPNIKDPFSPTHFANAIALFITSMRR